MLAFCLSGSPRTAARQLVELLTRDNILDEHGNVNPATVEAACRYAGGNRCLDEWAEPRSPAATDGSTASSKSEIPDAISEPCTEVAGSEPDDMSRTQTPRES